jgi:glutaconate CoA-transferase subunit A
LRLPGLVGPRCGGNADNQITLDAFAAVVPDGAELTLPPDNFLASCELARALVRRGARVAAAGVPVSGYATDLLIGAGCGQLNL